MKMVIEIPDTIDLDEKETKKILAAKLFEMGILSSGQGAEMAGCSKRTFIEQLGNYNVSLFNYENISLDLTNDIANAKSDHI